MRIAVALSIIALTACGTSGSQSPDGSLAADASAASAADAGAVDASAVDASQTFTLKIDNVSNWCSVTVNGMAYTSGTTKTYTAGEVVQLHADAKMGFIWGFWTGTDGDTSADHDKRQSTTVTMTSNKDVTVCCPFPNGSGC